MTARVLLFGAGGQLGAAFAGLKPAAADLVAHDARSVDIRDRDAVGRAMRDAHASVVVNCAAFTNVDAAEAQPDVALAVNGEAPGVMAVLARDAGIRFVHVSTDFVFDGLGGAPYAEDAAPRPVNHYGESKLEGERRVLAAGTSSTVVRTAWVHSAATRNFVADAVRRLASGSAMRYVDDHIGTPTRAAHLAAALWRIVALPEVHGILHFTDAGVASRYDVAVAVLDTLQALGRAGHGSRVEPVGAAAFPTAARRPVCSVLDKRQSWSRLGITPPHWRVGIAATTRELLHA